MSAIRIPWAKPAFRGREAEYVREAVFSTRVSSGPYIERLEADFAAYVGSRHAIAVMNGTAALHLAYLAAGIRPGDEVLVPSMTFVATAAIVVAMGAVPRFVDCDPRTLHATPETVRRALTPKSRALVAVHLFGHAADAAALGDIAREKGLVFVEDAAEGFGARIRGKHVGTVAPVGTFSFQAAKTITTGEGGVVVTDDDRIAASVRLHRDHGMTPGKRYWHEVVGFNYRMTNLQAAVGCAQLERSGEILASRARIAARYAQQLARVAGVSAQAAAEGSSPALWAQALMLDPARFPQGRDAVRHELETKGIETRPLFYPCHTLPPYREYGGECPEAERVAQWGMSLPVFEEMTDAEVDEVCAALASASR